MKIFAVDTSARSASVALVENDVIRGEYFINTMLTHSETLMPMINSLLNSTKITLKDIDCFAVNCGPGSFTGLRIGIAAVKGMAFALDKPCAAVSTLESMAYNIQSDNTIVCAVMDARCNQVYNALFDVSGKQPVRMCEDRALQIDELAAELKKIDSRIVFVGDGAGLCHDRLSSEITNVELASENVRFQRASSAAFCAKKLIDNNKTVAASKLMPVYLRLPQAQRELIAKRKINDNGDEHTKGV